MEESSSNPLSDTGEEENISVKLSFTMENTGAMDGSEAAQVYIAAKDSSLERPVHELKEFTKKFLRAGEKGRAKIKLDKTAFGCYHPEMGCFYAEPGQYEIQIGSSSVDIRLTASVTLGRGYRYKS